MAEELAEEPGADGGSGRRRRPGFGWAAWLVAALGVTASCVGAYAWASYDRDQGQRQFHSATATVAANLSLTLARDDSVMATTKTLVATQPGITSTQFTRWFEVLGAASRYPGSFDFAYVARVPAAGVLTFAQTVEADPPYGAPAAPFVISPPGRRPSYCFLRLSLLNFPTSVQRAVASDTAQIRTLENPGLDECQTGIDATFHRAEASGQLATADMSTVLEQLGLTKPGIAPAITRALGGYQPFVMILPVYAGGSSPTTTAARQADLAGWVEGIFDSAPVLGPVVRDLHGGSLELSFRNPGGATTVFDRIGSRPPSAFTDTATFSAGGLWTLSVWSPSAAWSTDPSPTVQGLGVLVIGVLFSVLLFLLVGTLNTSRVRALALVDEKTEELRHQALHDPLTGLPNRSLILEQADRLLALARRNQGAVSLLFVDLDGFKEVNDTLGHRVGDELLCSVADRIVDSLRDADTVGRLGGDEFVVLADVAEPAGGAVLAQRLLDALETPFELPVGPTRPIRVTASIGVATGTRESADDLLRDADLALYRAKDLGKGRYVLFEPTMSV